MSCCATPVSLFCPSFLLPDPHRIHIRVVFHVPISCIQSSTEIEHNISKNSPDIMGTIDVALVSKPCQPQERTEHDLLSESYADAGTRPPHGLSEANRSHAASFSSTGSTVASKPTCNVEDGADGSIMPPGHNAELYRQLLGNGQVLTSVKPTDDYERSLIHDQEIAPRRREMAQTQKIQDAPMSQLKTGRQAGAGWQRSAYVR